MTNHPGVSYRPWKSYALQAMPFTARRPAFPAGSRHGHSRLRRWAIPVIGAVTPVGLIVVNIAVFIANHLLAFRWTIAVLAFVSGMMLNGWVGLKIYRLFQRRFSEHVLAAETNQDMVLVGGMAVIIGISFVTALFCWLGLSNEANLPNATTFLTGILAILVPFALQFIFERALNRGSRRTAAGRLRAPLSSSSLPPPPPPPFSQPPERGLERRR